MAAVGRLPSAPRTVVSRRDESRAVRGACPCRRIVCVCACPSRVYMILRLTLNVTTSSLVFGPERAEPSEHAACIRRALEMLACAKQPILGYYFLAGVIDLQ